MTVLLVLFFCIFFLTIDYFKAHPVRLPSGTMYTTPGFEMLGSLAQDGGKMVTTQDGNEGITNDYQI
jgi:hypothetical protein